MRIWLTAVTLATALLPGLSIAAGTSIPIGMMTFTLGQPKQAVMSEVEKHFQTVKVNGLPDRLFLIPKGDSSNSIIGAIAFEDGHLAAASRNWGRFQGNADSVEVASAIFAAIESATDQSGKSAAIGTEIRRVPGAEWRSITYSFPGREVSVVVAHADAQHGGDQVTVDERIAEDL